MLRDSPGVNSADFQRFWFSMGRTERQREIARRRKRKTGLAKVRQRFAASKNEGEKAQLLAKARRMSPFIELE
ncbi:MAG: DUF6800 family protein [Planctomycetaceae bacterium]|jgi:hypothetical protein